MSQSATPAPGYLGQTDKFYLGYSNDTEIREGAASGGMVTAYLAYLLDTGRIDGAIVSRSVIEDGQLRVESLVARSRAELLSCRTSIYCDFPQAKSFQELLAKEGRYAIVSLPCHLKALGILCQKYPELAKRVAVRISLWCGHVSEKRLVTTVLERRGISLDQAEKLQFRKGHWRGQMHVDMKDGSRHVFPYFEYGFYQNLFVDAAHRCLSCDDHFGYQADVCFGDAWIDSLKNNPIKHSLWFTRTQSQSAVFDEMAEKGLITAGEVKSELVMSSQKRSVNYHTRALAARQRIGRWFGYPIHAKNEHKPHWNDYLSSAMILSMLWFSEHSLTRKLLFGIPRKMLWPYFATLKVLQSF